MVYKHRQTNENSLLDQIKGNLVVIVDNIPNNYDGFKKEKNIRKQKLQQIVFIYFL